MDTKNEFKYINIKNNTCHYFDDMVEVENINVDNICIRRKIIRKYFSF